MQLRILALGVMVLGALTGCGQEELTFCRTLVLGVDDLPQITWTNDGSPVESAAGSTWEAVFSLGITHADDRSRTAIARAVAADVGGYTAVRDTAPEELRPSLDRLHRLVQDPDLAAERQNDPEVLDDIAAIVAATPPSKCGWAR